MTGIFCLVVVALLLLSGYHGYQQGHADSVRDNIDQAAVAGINQLPPDQQRFASMVYYLGFHWANERLFPAVCRDKGFDLQDYSTAFHDRYANAYERVHEAFDAQGGNERDLIVAFNGNDTVRTGSVAMLETFGDLFGGDATVAEGCAVLQKRQDVALGFADFETLFPSVWRRMELP